MTAGQHMAGSGSKVSLAFMNFLRKIAIFFTLPPPAPSSTDEAIEESTKRIVAACTHGNLRLQYGQFYTGDDVNSQYERIQKIKFI
ncbi:MAG: hypothetical protein IIB62_12930 [Proteobacteria bacterium]|nr:hypothetical protein [Pseudomonadota bacterium]